MKDHLHRRLKVDEDGLAPSTLWLQISAALLLKLLALVVKTTYLHRLAVRIKIIIKHEVENCWSIGRIRTIVVQRYTLHHLPLKVLCSLYVLSAMCVTTYLKAMLTDGFLLSVSSRAANYAPHRLTMLHGELSATSPAHHRMAINHLLQRFCMMPFLGLVATQRGKYDYYSKSCGRSYLPYSL